MSVFMNRDVRRFLSACDGFDGRSPTPALVTATSRFLSAVGDDPALLGKAAAALPTREPAAAAWIAVTLGTAIETGASTQHAGPQLLAHFVSELGRPPTAGPAPISELDRRLASLKYLCTAVVAHLARMPQERQRLAADGDLIARLEDLQRYSVGALWVGSALRRTSGPLVLLHPASRQGLLLRAQNVERCFHLFSLIQSAVGTNLPGGGTPDPAVVDSAHGRSEEHVNDAAWWNFGDPRSPEAHSGASIRGEGEVRAIPLIDGHLVVLLWPLIPGHRGWDSGFFEPHLDAMPADVTIERELVTNEADQWFARLGIAPA